MEQCRQLGIQVEGPAAGGGGFGGSQPGRPSSAAGGLGGAYARDDSTLRPGPSSSPLPAVGHHGLASGSVSGMWLTGVRDYPGGRLRSQLAAARLGPAVGLFLLQGWEQRHDSASGSTFYIDHNARQTFWEEDLPPPLRERLLAARSLVVADSR